MVVLVAAVLLAVSLALPQLASMRAAPAADTFDHFGAVRSAHFQGHPISPASGEVPAPGPGVTEGWVIETFAYNLGGE